MLRIDDLITAKFVNHGRSVRDGFDCYGLVIEVEKRLGRNLPDLWYERACSETAYNIDTQVLALMKQNWEETDEQGLGNIILFPDGSGHMVHMGVFLEEGRFLHADIGGVKVTELEDYYRKQWKVYKWRQ